MFEDLKKRFIKSVEYKRDSTQDLGNYDASKFNDEVAMLTKWQPKKPGGIRFKVHKLKQKSADILKVQLSVAGMVLIGAFVIIAMVATYTALYNILFNDIFAGLGILLFALIFSGFAFFLVVTLGQPTTFNRSISLMYKGFKLPKLSGSHATTNSLVYFNDIHAIQVVSEFIKPKRHKHSFDTGFTSYEINLVLKNASRINLIDHDNFKQIKIEAKQLSAFLGKKIWIK